jgi:hypothetical protein
MDLFNNSESLLNAVREVVSQNRDILAEKKKLHPNQQKLDVHEPEKDELTADDFKKLRAMKKEEKCGECGNDPCTCDQSEEVTKEEKDTPGNSYTHQCAIHVKHEQFGEGKTLTTQHADPDEEGNIAWYDVMFEHGIEKEVKIEDLEVLVSESHMHHKKKMKEEVEDVEEARGRPRKTPKVGGEGESDSEPDQNIVNHLKKSIDTKGNHDVRFDDKSTHKVPGHVAHKVLTAMGKLKPADRLEVQKHIQQSHKNLMDVHGMVK